MNKYYLVIIHRKFTSSLAIEENTGKILLYSELENAKKKAHEILDSGDYNTSRIDVLYSEFEDIEEDLYYKIVG
jgi:hypothetical protein